MNKRALELCRSIALFLGIGILYYAFYTLTDLGFKCPIYELTGLLCPTCGLSRMCVALLNFDFSSAFFYNSAFLLLSPALLTVIISYSYKYVKFNERKLVPWQKILLLICAVIFAIFGILRNILDLGLSS